MWEEGRPICQHSKTKLVRARQSGLEAAENTSANIRTLSKAPRKRKNTKALIAPRVRIEKSLSVIGLPFLPPSLEEEEDAGLCAQAALSSRPVR